MRRRTLILAATLAPLAGWQKLMATEHNQTKAKTTGRLVLSDFTGETPYAIEGGGWRGFSDRVMGGISDAAFGKDIIDGKTCARMAGTVTRESNGGFIQMAFYFGRNDAEIDASGYTGVELLVYGNNEDYNVHIRTADCGWYEQSYRTSFFAKPEWQTVRIPFTQFEPNGLKAPLDTAHINRIALLGWMREFQADIALAQMALYS